MLLERVRRHSLELGDKPALVCGGETVRWGELWPWAERLAARLTREGTGPVAVESVRSAWAPVAFLACLMAGRPYLPLDPGQPKRRREAILARTGARVLGGEEARAAFSAGGTCPPAQDGSRIAYLLFTSGSTGTPKEVAVSLSNLENFLRWAEGLEGVAGAAGQVALGHAAYSFDLSVADLYLALSRGGTHVGLTEEELARPDRLFRRLTESGAAFLAATPSFLRLCLRERDFSPRSMGALRTVFSCGEELPPKTALGLLERFPGLRLWNAYGPTEATCAVCAAQIVPELCGGPLPMGRVGEGAAGISLEDGELVLRGASVAPAYGGVYHTGDLGYAAHGMLYWKGRRDDQIKYKGYRIEPAEVEAALETLAGVERAAVLPITGAAGQVRGLAAFWEGAAQEPPASAAAEMLPPWQRPREWRRLDRLPMTPNGKIDRGALKEMLK